MGEKPNSISRLKPRTDPENLIAKFKRPKATYFLFIEFEFQLHSKNVETPT
jgi:hypothetical protein